MSYKTNTRRAYVKMFCTVYFALRFDKLQRESILVLIKSTELAVALRLRCGCVAVPVNWFFDIISHVLQNLRKLYIVWSLVRRRVTRRHTRLQTMCNVFKYRKIHWNIALRLRYGCIYPFNLLKTSTVRSWRHRANRRCCVSPARWRVYTCTIHVFIHHIASLAFDLILTAHISWH